MSSAKSSIPPVTDTEEVEEETAEFVDEVLQYVTSLNFLLPALLSLVLVYFAYVYLSSKKKVSDISNLIMLDAKGGEGIMDDFDHSDHDHSHPHSNSNLNSNSQQGPGEGQARGMITEEKELQAYKFYGEQLEKSIKGYEEFVASKKEEEMTLNHRRNYLVERLKNTSKIANVCFQMRQSNQARIQAKAITETALLAYQVLEGSLSKEMETLEAMGKELDDPENDPKDAPFHTIMWGEAKKRIILEEGQRRKAMEEAKKREEEEANRKKAKARAKNAKKKDKKKAQKQEIKKVEEEEKNKKVTEELLKEHGLEHLLEKDKVKETKENGN